MALGIFTTDPDEVSKSMFDQEQRLARLRDEQARQQLIAGENYAFGLNPNPPGVTQYASLGTGEDLSRFNVGLRYTPDPLYTDMRKYDNKGYAPAPSNVATTTITVPPNNNQQQNNQQVLQPVDEVLIEQPNLTFPEVDPNKIELPPAAKGKNKNNPERVAEIKRRADIDNQLREIQKTFGIRRKAGQGTKGITGQQGDAFLFFNSKEFKDFIYQYPDYVNEIRKDPFAFMNKYKSEKGARVTSETISKTSARTTKLINGRIEAIDNDIINGKNVRELVRLANIMGVDPIAAIAIFGIESDFGRNVKKSSRAAYGSMQVTQDQFGRLKKWFTDPNNRGQLDAIYPNNPGMVDKIISMVGNMERAGPKTSARGSEGELVAGLAQLIYNKAIGLDKNLWGAGYQANANKVLEAGKPMAYGDGLISNSDYNTAYTTLYNYIAKKMGTSGSLAGLNTANVASVPSGGSQNNQQQFKINQGGQSATGNYGSLQGSLTTGEEPKENTGVDTGGPSGPTNDDRTNFYLSNPTRLGRDLNNAISGRTLIKEQAERDIFALWTRAQAFRSAGVADKYLDLMDQIRAIQTNAETQIFNQDMNIQQLNGMQALSDLFMGSTQRASFILSETKGTPHLVVPRDDGKFDIEIDGKLFKTMNFRDISDYIRISFDEQYRVTKATTAAELSKLSLEQFYALQKIDAEGRNKLAEIVAQMEAKITEFGREYQVIENYKGQNIPALVSKDGKKVIIPQLNDDFEIVNYYTINPQIIPANAYETD